MKTIQSKLFLIFFACIAAFALLSILLNQFFLESYYIFKNQGIFLSASTEIVSQYQSDPNGISALMNRMDRTEAISSIITDQNGMIRFSSYPMTQANENPKLPSEIEQAVRSNADTLKNGYVYTTIETSDYKIRMIVFIQKTVNGDILVLRKPITAITESAGIANEFLLYTGLVIVGIGGIIIYFLSKRMTRPIVQMSGIAKSMADLSFKDRLDIRSKDEIGLLARSIYEMAEKLSVSMASLKQDVERRKLLVRNLSHELKTPIGVIKGYTEGLQYGIAEDPVKFSHYCSVIKEECDRMDGMIQELLDLSRLESGVFPLHIETLHIKELLQAVAQRFEQQIKNLGISLSTICSPETVMVADRSLMDRLLGNYVSNASRHAAGKNEISIEARELPGRVRLSVTNTGLPINEKDLTRVWDVFFRADQARSRGGHGLGLSIVKTIVELHGGTCGVKNLSDGVCFFAEIPK
ncbi:MAG: HAMP domain-containing sensor histidine kinase [Eubacteriales bacterium]